MVSFLCHTVWFGGSSSAVRAVRLRCPAARGGGAKATCVGQQHQGALPTAESLLRRRKLRVMMAGAWTAVADKEVAMAEVRALWRVAG